MSAQRNSSGGVPTDFFSYEVTQDKNHLRYIIWKTIRFTEKFMRIYSVLFFSAVFVLNIVSSGKHIASYGRYSQKAHVGLCVTCPFSVVRF
jgi:hypothetical protein